MPSISKTPLFTPHSPAQFGHTGPFYMVKATHTYDDWSLEDKMSNLNEQIMSQVTLQGQHIAKSELESNKPSGYFLRKTLAPSVKYIDLTGEKAKVTFTYNPSEGWVNAETGKQATDTEALKMCDIIYGLLSPSPQKLPEAGETLNNKTTDSNTVPAHHVVLNI